MRPSLLEGRNLLDCAALLRIDPFHAELWPEVKRLVDVGVNVLPEDQEPVADVYAACRRYLGKLFPALAEAEVDEAWKRACALEEATTRVALKQHGYPQAKDDRPPRPQKVCPGFSGDIYAHALERAMFALR